jgi:peptide/nickel transport system ATP-binding protein
MALALSPRLLVMDEPTTALDVVVQRELLTRLSALRRELGLTILLITHDLPLLLELADRIGIMYAGELVELAPAARFAEVARHPYTRGLLAAFPHLGTDVDHAREIPGVPPSLAQLPGGCRFQPRCSQARRSCASDRPALRPIGAGQLVACPWPLARPGEERA